VSGSARARRRIRIPRIQVRYLAEGIEGVGYLKNVSRAGVFVSTREIPRVGAVIAVQFRTVSGSLVDLRGEVRWNSRGLADPEVVPGFGVLLHEPPREFREFYLWVASRLGEDGKAGSSLDL
jgi:hypothetical protein